MKNAMTGSFSYSRLEPYSENAGHSRQQSGGDWLTRSFKFLLGGAPTAEESRGDCVSGDLTRDRNSDSESAIRRTSNH